MSKPSPRAPRWGSWFLAACVAGVTASLALDPAGRPRFISLFGVWDDKVEHACVFALLAAIVALRGPAPRALIALVVFAVVIETAQIFIPLRKADLADLAASLAGIALGWLVAATGRAAWKTVRSSMARYSRASSVANKR